MKITVRQLKSLIREAIGAARDATTQSKQNRFSVAPPSTQDGVKVPRTVDANAGRITGNEKRGWLHWVVDALSAKFHCVAATDMIRGGILVYLTRVPSEDRLAQFFESQPRVKSWELVVAGTTSYADEPAADGPALIIRG